MDEIVPLSLAKQHLRIDDNADDVWLSAFIPAATQAVADWLKDTFRLYSWERDASGVPILDSNDDVILAQDSNGPIPHPTVIAAILIELGSLYRFREGEGKDNVVPTDAGHGYVLNKTSTALLQPLRKPTVS